MGIALGPDTVSGITMKSLSLPFDFLHREGKYVSTCGGRDLFKKKTPRALNYQCHDSRIHTVSKQEENQFGSKEFLLGPSYIRPIV